MSCYSERAEILKIKDEYRSEFEDFYYGRYEKIKTQFLRDYLDETAGQKHCDKISSLNGVTYYEEYSVLITLFIRTAISFMDTTTTLITTIGALRGIFYVILKYL